MLRKIIFPPFDYGAPSPANPSQLLSEQARGSSRGAYLFGSRDNFFRSRGKNQTISVSKFKQQINHSSDFDSILSPNLTCNSRPASFKSSIFIGPWKPAAALFCRVGRSFYCLIFFCPFDQAYITLQSVQVTPHEIP